MGGPDKKTREVANEKQRTVPPKGGGKGHGAVRDQRSATGESDVAPAPSGRTDTVIRQVDEE